MVWVGKDPGDRLIPNPHAKDRVPFTRPGWLGSIWPDLEHFQG